MDIRTDALLAPKAPRLPNAPAQYNAFQSEQYSNLLRLYFNQIDSTLQNVLGPYGGRYIDCPNGLVFSMTSSTAAATNTAYALEFEVSYLTNSVRVDSTNQSRVYCDTGGIYNFQMSAQLTSNSASSKQVWIWISRDGTDIGYSTHQYTISGSDSHQEVSWNFNIDMQAGQYLELKWATSDTGAFFESVAPTSPHPGIPSAVLAVNFIAPLPATLPTPP